MDTLHLELPSDVTIGEAALFLAITLWEKKRISTGQAAKLAGCTIEEFMLRLGEQNIPFFNQAPEDFELESGR